MIEEDVHGHGGLNDRERLLPGAAQQDTANTTRRDIRELLDAGAVFLWVHPGTNQPRTVVPLLEAIRSLGLSAPGWCARLASDAERTLDRLAASPNARYEPVADPSALYSVAGVLRRASERIAAAADVLSPIQLDDDGGRDVRSEAARATASAISVVLDLLREALASGSTSPSDLMRVACSLQALAKFCARNSLSDA